MNEAMVLGCMEKGCSEPKYCKKLCRKHYMRNYRKVHKIPYSERNVNPIRISKYQSKWRKTIKGRWSQFRKNSANRGIKITITFKDFGILTGQNCFYCGGKSPNRDYVGIDRIDNAKGYTVANSRSCCSLCNAMKSNLDEKQWYSHMERILTFSRRNMEKEA